MKKSILLRSIALSVFTLGIIAVTVQCATPNLSSRAIEFNENGENGLIVGSITFPTLQPRFTSYSISFTSLNGETKTSKIFIEPEWERKISHNGELNNGKSYLFAVEKMPGKYAIDKIVCSATGYENTKYYDKVEDFAIPFEVKKGEIVYIGEILFDEYATEKPALINLQSNYKRDMEGLALRQPSIDWTKAKKSSFELNKTN